MTPGANEQPRAWSGDLSREDVEALHALRAKRRSRSGTNELTLNMIPMIDVVVQLLVYFLLVTNFTVGAEVLAMKSDGLKGAGASATAADPFDLPEEPVVIQVSTRRKILGQDECVVNVGRVGPDSVQTPADLGRFLRSELRSAANPGGMFTAQTPMRIVPAPTCRWGDAVEALNVCLRAGYTEARIEASAESGQGG